MFHINVYLEMDIIMIYLPLISLMMFLLNELELNVITYADIGCMEF